MDVEASPLFDAELAAFMQGGISLNVAACGIDLAPSVARAVGTPNVSYALWMRWQMSKRSNG